MPHRRVILITTPPMGYLEFGGILMVKKLIACLILMVGTGVTLLHTAGTANADELVYSTSGESCERAAQRYRDTYPSGQFQCLPGAPGMAHGFTLHSGPGYPLMLGY